MNANEARSITLIGKDVDHDFEDWLFLNIRAEINAEIEMSAGKGNSKVVVDLKKPSMAQVMKIHKRLQVDLERDGFGVTFMLTRTPNGAREIIITW